VAARKLLRMRISRVATENIVSMCCYRLDSTALLALWAVLFGIVNALCLPCITSVEPNISILLGRVALVAQQTFPWTISPSLRRSVGASVRTCVCPPGCLCIVENGEIDQDVVWRHRSNGSRDMAGSGVWGSAHGKGYFWGQIWGAPL